MTLAKIKSDGSFTCRRPYSVMLLDSQSRTATWLMLDPAKMSDYFAAVASQAEGLHASSRGVERSDTPGKTPP